MKAILSGEGWRKFLFEIAVVVVGVLLALGAQELVGSLSRRAQVNAFRQAIDAEIAYNFAAYQDRLNQSACLKRRLDELDRWLVALRTGSTPSPTAPIGAPDALTLRTSAWEGRTDVIVGNIAFDRQIDYAVYASFASFANLGERERGVWQTLQEFDGASDLDRRDLMRLRGLVTTARRLNLFTEINWPRLVALGRAMGINPRRDASDPPSVSSLCEPLYGTVR